MGEQRADPRSDQSEKRSDIRHRGLPLRRRPRRAPRLQQEEEKEKEGEGK